jgi:glycosyltransferase involved in cell wall biosynthesis
VVKLSVVIPTLNRADVLATTIDRIEHQTIAQSEYEVLVIDNNSSDDTRRVLTEKSSIYPNLRALSQVKPGAAATRNAGIREAVGELILFIDDDIFAEPDLVEVHLRHHRSQPDASVIGKVLSPWEDSTEPFLRYLRDRAVLNPYNLADAGPMDFAAYHTGNVSTPLKCLRDAGGFNEEFSVYGMEDIELGYRLEKMGCRMHQAPDARAHHEYFPAYDWFIKRCEQAGYSLGKMIELHPELGQRFTKRARYPRLLRWLRAVYPLLVIVGGPVFKVMIQWDSRRGTGRIHPLLEQHFYWSIRYHFFIGYREYLRCGSKGGASPPVSKLSKQGLAKLAVERHE